MNSLLDAISTKRSLVLLLLSAAGCAAGSVSEHRTDEAPLIASAVQTPKGCLVRVNGETIEASRTDGELVALVSRWPNRRAVLRVGRHTPYRCAGRLMYVLQRAEFSFAFPWVLDE